MKLLSTLLLVFTLVFTATANKNDLNQPNQELHSNQDGGVVNQEGFYKNTEDYSDLDQDYDEAQVIESDSSYYSVNKFNILLYFVYKLKYGEEETPTED